MTRELNSCNTGNRKVIDWVGEVARLCEPDAVYWCDGSAEEKERLTSQAVAEGILVKLDGKKWPGCYYHRSDPRDVARVEDRSFICAPTEEDAGPTNNWASPKKMYDLLYGLARGAMKGRTLYVVPYLMGPPGSSFSKVGVELTDSIYVVLSMGIMTRMGSVAWDHLGEDGGFNRGLHTMLDMDPEKRYIVHFPQDNTVISLSSNYGGNVLLGKKCFSLRIASYLGRDEGWMAEHMLIICVESPEGEKTYVAAAFPSGCGKTNFAMLVPPKHFEDWKVWTIGDDIAWMRPGPDGRLYAVNPEAGYFGIVPGTNRSSNPIAIETISKDTIFTNVALTDDGDLWWEGRDGDPPSYCLDWRGRRWTPDSGEKAAHPNSRFAAPMRNNPILSAETENPDGVPISAIIFGERRAATLPLVFQSFNWIHGVYIGATLGSETTAAAEGTTGNVRRDPMAMLPFCGYNMGDYFRHWIGMRRKLRHPPRVFNVNWFLQDRKGNFRWPGYGENMRILKWIVDRCRGRANAIETPLGWVPDANTFDLEGIEGFDPQQFEKLQYIDTEGWRKELISQDELFMKLYSHLPKELIFQRELLVSRL
jgi:phosphoenolpyruvate carboxykinase (GTP)